jgi:outer membrane protein
MKKWLSVTTSCVLLGFLYSKPLLAADLLTVYQDALANDPTFQMYHYQWLSDKQYIWVTSSYLLPQVDLTGGISRNMQKTDGINLTTGVANSNFFTNQGNYGISLSQTIFNFNQWEQVRQASSIAKSSEATYTWAAQDLINRTATAYFTVLQDIDILRYARAYRESLAQQLERSKERYKVGLVAITDVDQNQAAYDSAVAQEITDSNNVDVAKEQLRAITNKYYDSFAKLNRDAPLLSPQPAQIDQWVNAAQRQSYQIASSLYASEAAHDYLKAQAGSGLPTIKAVGAYDYTHNDYNGSQTFLDPPNPPSTVPGSGKTINKVGMIGLSADFPVIQGGGVISRTYQAEYLYQKALSTLEQTRRMVITSTREAYLSVISGIGTVQADKQAIISNTSALRSTQEGYLVGTQTMVDVLTAESNLYLAQQQFITDQTKYILQTIALKEYTGVLSYTDLQQINVWLKENPTFSSETMPSQVKAASTTKVIENTATTSTDSSSSISSKNPQHYTIQLIASNNQKEVTEFNNSHHFATETYTVATYRNNQKWYILTTGDYKTSAAAQAAAKKLAGNPWVRSFGSIQKLTNKQP